jgi:hypothetical protein
MSEGLYEYASQEAHSNRNKLLTIEPIINSYFV